MCLCIYVFTYIHIKLNNKIIRYYLYFIYAEHSSHSTIDEDDGLLLLLLSVLADATATVNCCAWCFAFRLK
jgi:hypothetical protein